MSRLLAIAVAALVALPAQAKYPSWKEIMESPKYKKTPTQEQVHKVAVKPTADYQLFDVADRYGFLFDPDGYPVAVFDYTMDPMTLKDMLLGSVGIGGWSLKSMWSKYKKLKENPQDVLNKDQFIMPGDMPQPGANDQNEFGEFYKEFADAEAKNVSYQSGEDVERGVKEFKKLKFTKEWADKHRGLQVAGADKDDLKGFAPATFTMADLYMDPKHESKVMDSMKMFAKLFFNQELTKEQLPQFLTQFQMDWNDAKKEFNLNWKPQITGMADKAPPVPGFVLYYYDIYNILAYKYSLDNMNRNVAYLESAFGVYGSILGIFVSRIVNGTESQMDFHENGLLTLFEAFRRGEYDINIPWEDPMDFADQSITLLYLNKKIENKNIDDITDGLEKRNFVETQEAKAKEDILKWLEKKQYTWMEWSDGRTATVYKGDKKKGIVSLSIARHWLSRTPSFLHYENAAWFKGTKRVLMEIFVDAVRLTLPQSLDFGKWLSSWFSLSINIYIPSFFWDGVFRGRQFTEIAYEGMAFMKINEAIAGRWVKVPGYTPDELGALKQTLATQRMNTWEVPLKYEGIAIKVNRKYVKDIIGQELLPDMRHAIP